MAMKNPPHSGPSVKKNCLDSLGRNGTEPAKVLGVARRRLSRVLNGHAAISPIDGDLPEKAGCSRAEFWLRRGLLDGRQPSAPGFGKLVGFNLRCRIELSSGFS